MVQNSRWTEHPNTAPWAFPPIYTTEMHSAGEPFCIFTSHRFSSGRGISIITTPSFATNILASRAFDDSTTSVMDMEKADSPVVSQNIKGKGIGLVASRTLYYGDRIFSPTPILVINKEVLDITHVSLESCLRMNEIGVERLPDSTRENYYSLMGKFGGNAVKDRIDTNSFDIEIEGQAYTAIFPETSRINHNCRPNVLYFFDPDTFRHYVSVTRTISKGEELGVAYTNALRTREYRREKLQKNWGFECSCRTCSAAPALAQQSDQRVKKIKELKATLGDWSHDNKINPSAGDLLVALFEQEGIWIGRAVAYQLAAQNWNSVGDKWNAVRYAMLAIEHGIIDVGPNDSLTREMRIFAENPENHWTWNKRN